MRARTLCIAGTNLAVGANLDRKSKPANRVNKPKEEGDESGE